MTTENLRNILLIEPFYSGSHKVLMDLIHEALKSEASRDNAVNVDLVTLPGKKWHWRARTSSLYFSQTIPKNHYTCIFTSSVLPLAELLGLRPDLQSAVKIIYFHENQLVYPVRKSKDRDFQYGYNQILSCLASDEVWFNSEFNRDSFLSNLQSFFKLQPDNRPKNLRQQIEPKCRVMYFPMDFKKIETIVQGVSISRPSTETESLKIVWNHRWEFDKNPELFFRVIFRLVDSGVTNFKLSIMGESFTDNPSIFTEAQIKLPDFILNFGYLSSKKEYYRALAESDIVISTSDHEFFGVSMMEATYLGCIPICPKNLVYPELYSKSGHLYNDEEELFQKLNYFMKNPSKLKVGLEEMNFELFDWEKLKSLYLINLLSKVLK